MVTNLTTMVKQLNSNDITLKVQMSNLQDILAI
jgi:hypothetical protein